MRIILVGMIMEGSVISPNGEFTRAGFNLPRSLGNHLKIFVAVICFATAPAAVYAEEGTFAQRNACRPEVFRLCNEYVPNRTAITNCLRRNRRHLDPECRAVFEGRLK
jgi:hypothetical protein